MAAGHAALGRRSLVAWLHGPSPCEDAAIGGKAATLRRLARAGQRVPAGFCLTAEASRHDVPAHRLAELLAPALARLAPDGAPLAVRSSALDEDGSRSSFAGQYETVLGVAPADAAAAVRACWASLWSDQVAAYRERRGLRADELAMPVLVQRLVPAEASVVAFSRDPLEPDADRIVVNATRGLGAPLVSGGGCDPDTLVFSRSPLRCLSLEPGRHESALVVRDGAVVTDTASWPPDEPAFDGDAATALAELCLDVESVIGCPVDVEAAYADGTWWVLQARPITA